jgi:hypothetical protein
MSEQLRSNDLVAFERIIHTNWRKTQHFEIYRGATTHSLAIGSPDRPQFSQALTYMSEWFPVNNSVLFVCWKQQTWCIRISYGVACCLSVCLCSDNVTDLPRLTERPADRTKLPCSATGFRGSNCVLRISAALCGLSEQRHSVMRAPYVLCRSFMLKHHVVKTYGEEE